MSKINKNSIINTLVFSLGILAVFALTVIATVLAFTPKEAGAYYYGGYYYTEPGSTDNSYNNTNNLSEDPSQVPGLSSISPNFINTSNGPVTIRLTGYNFTPSSQVKVNNVNLATSYIDSRHLSARVSPSDVSNGNNNHISVWNPGNNGGFSNTLSLGVSVPTNTVNTSYTNTSTTTNTYKTVNNTSKTTTAKKSTANTASNGSVEGATDTNDSVGETVSSLAGNAIYGSNSYMPSGLIQWAFVAIFILLAVIAWRSISGREKYNATPMKHA